jgi:hypothetical protein
MIHFACFVSSGWEKKIFPVVHLYPGGGYPYAVYWLAHQQDLCTDSPSVTKGIPSGVARQLHELLVVAYNRIDPHPAVETTREQLARVLSGRRV